MVALKVPDRLSILTYVSQYYNYFQRRAPAERTAGVKRPPSDPSEEPSGKKAPSQPAQPTPVPARGQPLSPVSLNRTVQRKDGGSEGPPQKAGQAAGGSLSSTCGVCGQHVHLMQRHLADGRLYHRGCFRCKQCSGTLHSGAYRATGEPGVFVCSSHRPETASASPTSPSLASRWPGATSTDLETPGGLRKTREASGQRDTGPKARLPGWDPAAGSVSARGSTPAATNPPTPTSSQVPTGSPAAPRPMAGPAGGKASTHVTSSSLTIWPSPAGSPRPTGTSCAPDPCPATPHGWATPRVTAPQTKLSSRLASPVPASTPAWTPSSSKTQQARERFFQTPGGTPGPGPAAADTPSGDSRREQALSFLRKALPELGAPGRSPAAAAPAPSSHPRFEGPGASPLARVSQPTSPQTLSLTTRTGPPTAPGVGSSSQSSQEAKKGPAVSSGAVGAGAGSRPKPEAPLGKGPGASPQDSPEDRPAGWRARLKPVEKSPAHRAPEPKEPRVLGEPRAGDAAGKASGSSAKGIRITVTSVQVDRTPGAAGPGASLPATSASASPLKKLAVPASLDASGDWLQLEPLRKEGPARSQKEEEKGPPQVKPGRPLGPASVAAPPAKSATSPVRLHADYVPPEIQRQVQDIERQLDALELRGVELEKRLRAAEGDDSEDALMVDWFRLVHEKQLLLRLESELMYKARDQRLEERQLDLEGELRRLMAKPEGLKSPQDRQREQDLLDQYVDTVNNRSDIIDFLDEDRLREQEEDEVLQSMIQKLDLQRSGEEQRKKPRFRLSSIWSPKSRSRTPE
ncbi:MICAL-like protein 2 isoform X3 [Muntiacus reevesi]